MAKAKKKVVKKSVKRIARRKTTKLVTKKVKKVAKKVVAKKPKVVKPISNKVKIGNFAFEPIQHPSFPQMVAVTNAPKWAKRMIGKRYVDSAFATRTITALMAERVVDGGAKAADSEIKSVVGVVIEPIEITAVNVDHYGSE